MKLWETGAIYENGKISAAAGPSADGAKKTIAYSILQKHNTSGDEGKLTPSLRSVRPRRRNRRAPGCRRY